MPDFMTIDLNQVFETKEHARRTLRTVHKQLGRAGRNIFVVSVVVGILCGTVYDLNKRLESLERARKKEDEMAG